MLRNILVYGLLGLSMITVLAGEKYPDIEFIKDGEVIESREMTKDEYTAYMNLKSLEVRLEQPLAQMEQAIEVDVKSIEREVERIEKAVTNMRIDSLADLAQLSALGDIEFEKFDDIVVAVQPVVDQVTAMADELGVTATAFKSSLMSDYDEDEIDEIKIKANGEKVVLIN